MDENNNTGPCACGADEKIKGLLEQIEKLKKKNEILSNHVLELTQEIENVKSDFGNNR